MLFGDFIFFRFDAKRLNRGIKHSRKIRNLEYIVHICQKYKICMVCFSWFNMDINFLHFEIGNLQYNDMIISLILRFSLLEFITSRWPMFTTCIFFQMITEPKKKTQTNARTWPLANLWVFEQLPVFVNRYCIMYCSLFSVVVQSFYLIVKSINYEDRVQWIFLKNTPSMNNSYS